MKNYPEENPVWVQWHHCNALWLLYKGSCYKWKETFYLRVYKQKREAASNEQSKQITCQIPAGLLLTRRYLCLHYLIAYDLNESGLTELYGCDFAMTQTLFTDQFPTGEKEEVQDKQRSL